MPTYDYKCLDCGREVEYFHRMSEPPITICPNCQGRLTRLVSAGAGLIFKGSGFYITDYKKKNGSVGSAAKAKSNGETTPKTNSEKSETAAPTEKSSGESKSSSDRGAREDG